MYANHQRKRLPGQVYFLEICVPELNPMLPMANLCRTFDSTHHVMRSPCALLEHFQRDIGRIHRGHRLLTRCEQQCVSTRTASQVQCGTKRQELPQPQVLFTLGLLNLNPAPSTVSM